MPRPVSHYIKIIIVV